MKKLLLPLAFMLILFTDGFSQVTFSTGALDVNISQYGRLRLFTPDGTRHLQRASILVGSSPTAVFDYTNDAGTLDSPVLVTSPAKSDFEIYGSIDNSYSSLAPNVVVKINAYGWTNAAYTILKYNVKSNEAAAINASVGLDVIPEINETYGYDSVTYLTDKGVIRFHRGNQMNMGIKILSAPTLSSLYSFEWFDGYTADTNYWNWMHRGTLQSQYASNTADGPVTITAQPEHSLNPSEAFDVYYAYALGADLPTLLANIALAEQKYQALITSVDDKTLSGNQLIIKRINPNPAINSTTITYQLPENGDVKLCVINSLGQEIKTLVNARQDKGIHSVNLNAEELQTGVYSCVLHFNGQVKTEKLVVVR